ncbi:hypothetical protein BC941DRAFT_416552 [Chlamydoabsidia padenii]|nr:hypothetical protein BC941DRAFT_416552 [Chlamydoabsidia padenii]
MANLRFNIDNIFGVPSLSNDEQDQDSQTQLDKLKTQLSELETQKHELKNLIVEEKLTFLMTTSFVTAIPDPRRQKAVDMEEVQKQIIDHITTASESRYIQSVISNYRLSGCSTFIFQNTYFGIRLETYYNRRYYEPYYIFLPKSNMTTIAQHTIPNFIPTTKLEKTFLPDALDKMIQVLSDMLGAFVSRREQVTALKNYVDKEKVKIDVFDTANLSVGIIHRQNSEQCYCISIRYSNLATMYPSQVTVKIMNNGKHTQDLPDGEDKPIMDAFETQSLLEAYKMIFV